jgi:hypothetical protein
MDGIKAGMKVRHPIYGDGNVAMEPETFDSYQWSGEAAWCVFYRPQTGIASNWPYMVPTADLTIIQN